MTNGRSESMDIGAQVVMIIAIIASLYAFWMFTGHYIVNTSVLIASALIRSSAFVYQLLPKYSFIDSVFFFFVDEMFVRDTDVVISQLQNYRSSKPSLSDARNVFYVIGYFLRLPIAFLAIWGSYLCYRFSRPSQLKRSFDIFSLAKYSQEFFPQIRPAIMANLLSKTFNEGAYRQELSPIRFAILKGALTYISEDGVEYNVQFGKKLKLNDKKNIITIIDSYDIDEGLPYLHGRCKLDLKIIRKKFVYQITRLGRWESHEQLPPQLKALYATLLLMIKGGESNKEKAFALLDQFSTTFKSTRQLSKNLMFDDSGIDEVIEKLNNQVAVQKIQKKYTYTITVLNALYHRATHRRSKLPPSRFLWLKEVDIHTWYAMHHNLSPSAWTEGGGPRGMLLTENKLNKKANYPFTDNAIAGYLKYINSEGWLIEQPEYTTEVAI